MTDPARWKVLGPYLDEVLALDADRRPSWLDALAAREPEIAAELRTLLEARAAASREGFLSGHVAPPVGDANAGLSLGAYTLDRKIGQGGMGEVWLAHRSDGRYEGLAAVKLLDPARVGPAARERFRREGEILARLTHPNIARLIDAGLTAQGQPYLVLEYVDGEPIDRGCDVRRLGVVERVRLFQDVLAAAAHAHSHLVVHRDIKPSNVMLARSGEVKLLDFGIAKLLEDDVATLTRERSPLTPEFAAPEQVEGGVVTTASDVFALGGLLYLLLTGRHPTGLRGATPAEYLRAVVQAEPARASTVVSDAGRRGSDGSAQALAEARDATPKDLRRMLAGDLDNVLAKALAKDPGQRYATAVAFAEDLQRYLNHEPVRAREGTWPYRAARFVRRNRAMTALGTATAVAIVGGLAVATWQALEARRQRAAALQQLRIADATNSFTSYLLGNAAPAGTPFTAADLLAHGENVVLNQFAKDSPLRVHLLLQLAGHRQNLEDYEAAERLAAEALALSERSGGPLVRAQAACGLAWLKAYSGQLDEGARLMEIGLAGLEEFGDPALAGTTCLVEDSVVAFRRNDLPRAIASAARARDTLSRDQDAPPEQLQSALLALAQAESADGRAAAASASYGALDASYRKSGRERTGHASIGLSNWAMFLFETGQVESSVDVTRRVIELDRALDPSRGTKPVSLVNLANGLIALGQFEEADAALTEALAKAKGRELTRWLPVILAARAGLCTELSDLPRLEAVIGELDAAVKEAYPPPHWTYSLVALSRGRLALQRGMPGRALEEIDEAIRLADASKATPARMHRLLQARAEALAALGRFDEAHAVALQCVQWTETQLGGLPHSYRCGLALRVLGNVCESRGNREEATRHWQAAHDHFSATIGPGAPKTVAVAQKLGLPAR